jgi:hypothetical protein
MLILHSQAELFLNFGDTVLLEAFAHNRGSTGYEHKATGNFPFRDKLGVLVTGASRRGREGSPPGNTPAGAGCSTTAPAMNIVAALGGGYASHVVSLPLHTTHTARLYRGPKSG